MKLKKDKLTRHPFGSQAKNENSMAANIGLIAGLAGSHHKLLWDIDSLHLHTKETVYTAVIMQNVYYNERWIIHCFGARSTNKDRVAT